MDARRDFRPWIAFACALASAMGPRTAAADVAMQGVIGTNGNVRAVALSGTHLYVGGDFTLVGPPCGGWVELDPATGQTLPSAVQVTGEVRAAIPDGEGGWFLGGRLGGANGAIRGGLVHLLADGTLSPWAPIADRLVYALALRDGVLYVGGAFDAVDGLPRHHLAAIDAHTGDVLPWTVDTNSAVQALELAGDTLFVGGSYTAIGGVTRFGLAAVGAGTGAVLAWDAHLTYSGSPGFANKLVRDDSRLYIAGGFDHVGPLVENGFGVVEIASAAAVAAPKIDGNSVDDIQVHGSRVYVAGFFYGANFMSRPGVMALARGSLAITGWAPRGFDPTTPVMAIAAAGDRMITAEAASQNATGGTRWAAVDTLTGERLAWSPTLVTAPWAHVLCTDAGRLFAGGDFLMGSGVARTGLVELDLATGQLTGHDFSAVSLGAVKRLEVVGNKLYVSHESSAPSDRLYAFDLTTGERTAWNPVPDGSVNDLVSAAGRLFAAGDFTHIGGQPRAGVCELDPVTGAPTSWTPTLDGSGQVLLADGGLLYLGGSFNSVDGTSRSGMAAFTLHDLSLTDFRADVYPGPVYRMCTLGQDLVIAGNFSQVGGQSHELLAAVDATSGATRTWSPTWNSISMKYLTFGDLRAVQGQVLVAGSMLTGRLNEPDPQLFVGQVTSSPFDLFPIAPDGQVQVLGGRDGLLVLGGTFRSLGPVASAGVGILTSATTWVPPLPTPRGVSLVAWPDPARESVSLRLRGTGPGPIRVEIVDLAGRRERVLASRDASAAELSWDLRDASGKHVTPGVHFAIARGDGRIEAITRFVVIP